MKPCILTDSLHSTTKSMISREVRWKSDIYIYIEFRKYIIFEFHSGLLRSSIVLYTLGQAPAW